MLLRIATAAVLIPIVVALVWWGPPALLALLAAAIAVLAMIELFALGDRVGLRAFKQWTCFCAVLIFISQYRVGLIQMDSFSNGTAVIRNSPMIGSVLDSTMLLFF